MSPVTLKKVKTYIENTIRTVVAAERPDVAAAQPTVRNLALPFFASITVDRTDDAAAASACTAAANDCSLRGSVAFANLNPGTTIVVPLSSVAARVLRAA